MVNAPRYPTICKILYANLTPINGSLPEQSVERHYRDNARIEKAMDGCPAGQSVVLHSSKNGRSLFLIGPMRLRAGITLVVEAGTALWGSRDPRDYDVAPGSCGIVGAKGAGCKPLLLAEDAPHAAIMGSGVIDARGGAKLLGQHETWWELAHRAKVEDQTQAVPRLLVVRRSNDFTLFQITLRNSPNCHVTTEAVDGFTAWGLKLDTPKWARNTDGIDPQAGTTNVSVVDSYLRTGDDNMSPKSSGAGAVTHVTVRNVHFYNGHGFGIGSQVSGGISAVRVDGLTIDGADNGIRIKSDRSRGGLVEDVRFENVCMRGVTNPIVLTPMYTTFEGTKLPLYKGVLLRNVHSLGEGPVTLAGLDAAHRLEATLENVTVDGERPGDVTARHALLTVRRGNIEAGGEDVKVVGAASGGTPYACDAAKFVPFPEGAEAPASAEVIPPEDKTFYVAADGTGDYYSVQAAVNKVPGTGGVVLVAPGVYREHVVVRQSHVTLESANADARKTVIVSDTVRGPGSSPATVTVRGDDFVAENITFQNDASAANRRDGTGGDAQAIHLSGDRNVLRNVRLLGSQHAAFFGAKNCQQANGTSCEAGRSLVVNSYIAGNMDMIFGDGLVFFDSCELHSTEHTPEQGAQGFLTGQGKHYPGQSSAFVFRDARLTADAGVKNVFLGEPWRDDATVIYLSPQIGAHIGQAGFRERMPGTAARMSTAYFRVYKPLGSATAAKLLRPQEASGYGMREVLAGKDGWDPLTVH